jgi:hypothetical protein
MWRRKTGPQGTCEGKRKSEALEPMRFQTIQKAQGRRQKENPSYPVSNGDQADYNGWFRWQN